MNATQTAATVTARNATSYLGAPIANEWIVTFYTEDTSKGVGGRLRSDIRAWSKWFRRCGANGLTFVSRRPQYHTSHSGSMLLGTHWSIRVTT